MKIIGASVVFVCDREFRIIRDGGVVYEGERIVEVGGYEELVAKYTKSPSDSKILELESTFLNNAEKIQSIASLEKVDSSCEAMDCHADFQSTRNDRKNAASEKADSRACGKKADSKEKMDCHATATQRLAMTENNAISENAVSLENKRSGASVSSQVSLENSKEKMDCHATATQRLAMTENNAISENAVSLENKRSGASVSSQVSLENKGHRSAQADVSLEKPTPEISPSDSKILELESGLFKPRKEDKTSGLSTKRGDEIHDSVSLEKPTPEISPSDSKILELESGLFKPRKEDKTSGLSTKRGDEIHDSSPKAESPQTEFFSGCVLLPALINAHIHFEFSSNSTSFAYGSFEGWLASVMSKRDSVLADMPTAIESTIDEQLDSGVGSVGAISSYGADMQALAKSALKVVYFSEAIGANPAALDTLLADVKARFYAAKKLSSRSFFPALALHAPYSVHSVLAKHINPAALDTLLADVKARFYAAKKLSSRSFFPALALHAPYSVHSVLAKHIIAFAKEAFSKQALESTRPAHTINNPCNNPCEMSCTLSAHFLESNAERVWLESKDRASAPKGWFYDFYTQVLKIPSPGA